jgi:hypothetical protein
MSGLFKKAMRGTTAVKGGSLSSAYTGIDPASREGANIGQNKRGGASRRQPSRLRNRSLGPARTPLSS